MIDGLRLTVLVYAVAVAVGLGVTALRSRPRSSMLDAALLVLAVGVVFQAVVDLVSLAGGRRTDDLGVHLAYLFTSLAILPILFASAGKHSKGWSTAAFAIGCTVLAVVCFRLDQTAVSG